MTSPTPEAIAALIDVATGQLLHIGLGACPDAIEGPDTRDPACPACTAITAVQTAMEDPR